MSSTCQANPVVGSKKVNVRKSNRPVRKIVNERREELWRHYHRDKAGSPSEEAVVQEYLPLVKTVVGRLAMTLPSHVDMEDLYSSGLVGLLNGVRNYDPTCGTSFETYARVRIRGAVFDELRRMDWVPRSVHEKARKVQAAINRLEQENQGRVPADEAVAEVLNLSVPEYRDWLEEIRPATFICLDAVSPSDSEEGPSHYECIADQKQPDPVDRTAKRELARMIAERLEQLPEMQRKVLALYYFEDLRLREIAEVFGLTESRICQIHAQAILAIKAYITKMENMSL